MNGGMVGWREEGMDRERERGGVMDDEWMDE